MAGDEPYSLAKLVGEWLREASVLVLVFGLMDPLLGIAPEHGTAGRAITTIVVLVTSVLFFVLGVFAEKNRRRT